MIYSIRTLQSRLHYAASRQHQSINNYLDSVSVTYSGHLAQYRGAPRYVSNLHPRSQPRQNSLATRARPNCASSHEGNFCELKRSMTWRSRWFAARCGRTHSANSATAEADLRR
eukprot:6191864-Pleurochrysis_carterae.AAC.2